MYVLKAPNILPPPKNVCKVSSLMISIHIAKYLRKKT